MELVEEKEARMRLASSRKKRGKREERKGKTGIS